jgi:hypothetical protein
LIICDWLIPAPGTPNACLVGREQVHQDSQPSALWAAIYLLWAQLVLVFGDAFLVFGAQLGCLHSQYYPFSSQNGSK